MKLQRCAFALGVFVLSGAGVALAGNADVRAQEGPDICDCVPRPIDLWAMSNGGDGSLWTIDVAGNTTTLVGILRDPILHDVGVGWSTVAETPACSDQQAAAPTSTAAATDLPTTRAGVTPEAGDLPNGTYRVTFTAAQLDVVEPDRSPHKQSDGGTLEFYLKDGTYMLRGFDDGKPQSISPSSVYHVEGDTVTFTPCTSRLPFWLWRFYVRFLLRRRRLC